MKEQALFVLSSQDHRLLMKSTVARMVRISWVNRLMLFISTWQSHDIKQSVTWLIEPQSVLAVLQGGWTYFSTELLFFFKNLLLPRVDGPDGCSNGIVDQLTIQIDHSLGPIKTVLSFERISLKARLNLKRSKFMAHCKSHNEAEGRRVDLLCVQGFWLSLPPCLLCFCRQPPPAHHGCPALCCVSKERMDMCIIRYNHNVWGGGGK